jgi:anthranilate synthase component 1
VSFYPNLDTFRTLAATYNMVPVYRQLTSDSLTPVSAFSRIDDGGWSFLFESVVGGEKIGRYSFLGVKPYLTFRSFGRQVQIESAAGSQTFEHPQPFDELDRLIQQYRAPHLAGLPRFHGGAVGYAAYDAIRYIENLPNAPRDDRHIPDLSFAFYDQMVVFDNIRKVVLVVALAHIDPSSTEPDKVDAGYRQACERVDAMVEQLRQPKGDLTPVDIDTTSNAIPDQIRSNFTQEKFIESVEACKEYIRAGDFFQIVISQRFETETSASPLEIYRSLRVVNPSPFMVYLKDPHCTLVASSPEIMVRVENGTIVSRPLAGTRRRGANDEEDRRLAAELLADPKERAEHIMLVDLGRNDVGRVSQFSSVKLDDVMTVERYSHVMHITSNVTGKLAPGLTPLDALRACLPAGTVSGAPKVRAMQVIDEIEPTKRGPYAGAIGYVDFTGNMDTCIALRTMVVQGSKVHVQAGMGIVYDSDPMAEYQETLDKARGLFRAIRITEDRLQDRQPSH